MRVDALGKAVTVTYTFADCLGFAGGFTLGMVQAGFELVGKREMPGGFGLANCEANRALLGDRWHAEVGPAETWSRVDADVVSGNPPCSGFSVMTAKGSRGVDAKVNACMHSFSNYVAAVRPQIAIMESVPQAQKMGIELMRQLRANIEERTGLKYQLYHVMQNALDLGGAAFRPRYFWVVSQVPFGVEYPTVHPPTLRDVIGDFEGLEPTWELQPYRRPPSWWSKPARSDTGVVDGNIGIVSPYTRRCMELLEAVDGDWRDREHVGLVLKRYYEKHGDVPPSWAQWEAILLRKNFILGFTTMSRWPADRPARVITGAALGCVLHPWLPRTITHREAARIMGFPDDWRILPLRGTSGLAQTHGKGITVQCGKWIGEWARRALDGTPGALTGEEIGEREFFITAPHRRAGVPAKIVSASNLISTGQTN
jgi:DNA (cytosine-5)-methyltransferase 1